MESLASLSCKRIRALDQYRSARQAYQQIARDLAADPGNIDLQVEFGWAERTLDRERAWLEAVTRELNGRLVQLGQPRIAKLS